MKGKFIVFEGIDGCGKGTQMKLAASWLFSTDKDIDIYMTREPTRNFKEIRERMAKSKNARLDGEWFADAFVKDRVDHIKNYIQPSLDKGLHVLCDRYKYSTLAYQKTQGVDINKLISLHKGLPVPDLVLLFDLPVDVAFERRKNDGATEVFDKDKKFQEELRLNYLDLQKKLRQENIIIIDSNREIGAVFEDVKSHIKYILNQ
jgi:dTMP kinase